MNIAAPYRFRVSGLSVRSEMELPGVAPLDAPCAEDVFVRRRAVPEHLRDATSQGAIWELNETRFLLKLPDVARLLATDGKTVDVEPEPGVDPAMAMPFLLGTVFGALLLQRGALVLHGAAVAHEGLAYLFCGPSGIGKSSLAAALCRAGCHFVNDDVCAVRMNEQGKPVLSSDGRRLKLFEDSIRHLGLAERERGMLTAPAGKHYVEPPAPVTESPVPLRAVYVLRDRKLPGDPVFQHLSPLESAQALLDQSYRRRLALAMARRGGQVAITAAILRHAQVFYLTRSRDLNKLGASVGKLREHWDKLAPEQISEETVV